MFRFFDPWPFCLETPAQDWIQEIGHKGSWLSQWTTRALSLSVIRRKRKENSNLGIDNLSHSDPRRWCQVVASAFPKAVSIILKLNHTYLTFTFSSTLSASIIITNFIRWRWKFVLSSVWRIYFYLVSEGHKDTADSGWVQLNGTGCSNRVFLQFIGYVILTTRELK